MKATGIVPYCVAIAAVCGAIASGAATESADSTPAATQEVIAALVGGGGFCYNSRMKTALVFTAALVATFVSSAGTISGKSPDGRMPWRKQGLLK